MSELLQPKPHCGPEPKVIRLPNFTRLTVERSSDEVGQFAKSNMDSVKLLKVLTDIRPFRGRSKEEIMEFICYMFEVVGKPGNQICKLSEVSPIFYVIVSGELLYTRHEGAHKKHKQQPTEQKLYEYNYWGLECLFTGRNEKVSVTVTSQCRLFALTAKRFFWICKTAAKRTFSLQTKIMEILYKDLTSVQQFLGSRPATLHEQGMVPQKMQKLNFALRSRMLESFRQVDVPSSRGRPIEISSSNGESVIVYALSGCAKLTLERCAYRGADPESIIMLKAGEYHEIKGYQDWLLRQNSHQKNQPTVAYLITLRQGKRESDSTVE